MGVFFGTCEVDSGTGVKTLVKTPEKALILSCNWMFSVFTGRFWRGLRLRVLRGVVGGESDSSIGACWFVSRYEVLSNLA